MGDQFSWFYDIMAVAAILVCMFISGRKGAMKSVTTFVAYLLSAVIAVSLSSTLGSAIASSAMEESNAKKIDQSIGNMKFQQKVAEYIGTLDYGITVDQGKIAQIYNGKKDYNTEIFKYVKTRSNRKITDDQEAFNKKLTEGYAQIIKAIVDEEMSKYAGEITAKEIREHPVKFNEKLIPLMMNTETKTPAAEFISKEYVQPAYDTQIKLICFLIVFVLLLIIGIYFSHTLMGDAYQEMHIPSHVGGAFIGILKGGIIVFALAVLVRLSVIMGSNEMLFFNHKAIDKTYIFKYLYNYVSDHM